MAPTTNGENELARLATEIKDALTRADTPDWKRLDYYRSAGEGLTKAKELCPHGTWEKWLKDNFKLRERQAQKYMKFAEAPRKALLEDEQEAWRKASGAAKKGEPKKKPSRDDADTGDDGSRNFIPTLPKEMADEADELLPVLMEAWGMTDRAATVLEALRFARREVASCLKQSA